MKRERQDRTTALCMQIACDVYDEVIETHGRAVANMHPECLEADAKREIRRKTYDLIVERTRKSILSCTRALELMPSAP